MAIQAKITTIQGIVLEQAYINIQNPQIQKIIKTVITPATETTEESTEIVNSFKLYGSVNVYSNKEYYNNMDIKNKIVVETFSVVCDLDLEANLYTQAYGELKLNDRLSNIVDLENIKEVQ